MTENINKYEKIEEIGIPFYRYSYMISPQNSKDIFIWLYLSLFIYQNKVDKKDIHSYSDDTKEKTSRIILEKFGNIIDQQKLNKIIGNVEKKGAGFVIYNTVTKIYELDDNIESFLDTYESLFSSCLKDIMVYQNAITGEIVPFFKDESIRSNMEVRPGEAKIIFSNNKVKKPTSKMIKASLDLYELLQDPQTFVKLESIYEEVDKIDPFDEFDLEPEQVYFDDSFTFEDEHGEKIKTLADVEEEEKENQYDGLLTNFKADYIENSKVEFIYKVEIGIQNNELIFTSPFGPETDYWIQKSIKKACNLNNYLKDIIDNCETYIEKPQTENKEEITLRDKHDIADKLVACGAIYRRVKPLSNDIVCDYVIGIDERYANHDKYFFTEIGNLLEHLIKPLKDISYAQYRDSYSKEEFFRQIEAKGEYLFDYHRLMTKKIYDQWKDYKFDSFKADVAGIVIEKNLTQCNSFYYEFINDLFEIYDWRSKISSHDSRMNIRPSEEHVEKLFKVINVISELLEKEAK